MTQSTLISLSPNEYAKELSYCPVTVNLDICMAICNTLNDICNICSKQNKRLKFERV